MVNDNCNNNNNNNKGINKKRQNVYVVPARLPFVRLHEQLLG